MLNDEDGKVWCGPIKGACEFAEIEAARLNEENESLSMRAREHEDLREVCEDFVEDLWDGLVI